MYALVCDVVVWCGMALLPSMCDSFAPHQHMLLHPEQLEQFGDATRACVGWCALAWLQRA